MAKRSEGKEPAGREADYTPSNVPVLEEAHSKKESFRKGGRIARKAGGALGGAPAVRLDRKRGGSVMSRASEVSMRPGFGEGSPKKGTDAG